MKRVFVKVPATSGNMGSAFDVLGVALKLYNYMTLEADGFKKKGKIKQIIIEIEGEGKDVLPRNENNLVYKAIKKVFDKLKIAPSLLKLKINNNIPLARGLGSSASAIVGGVTLANLITGGKIKDSDLVKMAVDMEGHPDNVVPAFYGGVCLSVKEEGKYLDFRKIPFPKEVFFVVSVPNFALSTKLARSVLPPKNKKVITYKQHIEGMQYVAWFITELFRKRKKGKKVFLPLKDEWYHQPYRKRLIPGMDDVIKSAEKQGAIGAVLSGAGPSIIALVEKDGKEWRKKGDRIGRAMNKAFSRYKYKHQNIKSNHFVTQMGSGLHSSLKT